MSMDRKKIKEALWNPSVQENDVKLIFEQYRLCVQMADNISERREKMNKFFLALNGAIIAVAVPMLNEYEHPIDICISFLQSFPVLFVLIAVAYYWRTSISSYGKLNEAKFQVIGELEERLPARPYVKAEWGLLQQGKKRSVYQPLTFLESNMLLLFAFLYLALFVNHLMGW